MTVFFALILGSGAIAQVPNFQAQEIDKSLKIGYAVLAEDIDGDHFLDIVVVDQHQLVWYRNPTKRDEVWAKFLILDGQTRPDNVCIAAIDIVGDQRKELVLGAGWKPFDTTQSGQLVWLERSERVTDPWQMHPLPCDEPTVHRVRAIDIDGDGRDEIVHVPLMGRGATREANWLDGRPVAIIALKVPQEDPRRTENWQPQVLSQQLHVTHNFAEVPSGALASIGKAILVASYEGVNLLYTDSVTGQWATKLVAVGDQAQPHTNRGSSEIKMSNQGYVATIEPWHGNQVVVYETGKLDPRKSLEPRRTVFDNRLRWGHAIAFADLDGDKVDELIVGVRDDPKPEDDFKQRRGIRIYHPADANLTSTILENGGVAVEDLTTADLDCDGRMDIIAVGRATGNARIYWNLGR